MSIHKNGRYFQGIVGDIVSKCKRTEYIVSELLATLCLVAMDLCAFSYHYDKYRIPHTIIACILRRETDIDAFKNNWRLLNIRVIFVIL